MSSANKTTPIDPVTRGSQSSSSEEPENTDSTKVALVSVGAHQEGARLLYLSGVSDSQRELLKRTGVMDIVGDGFVFGSRNDAVLAAHAECSVRGGHSS